MPRFYSDVELAVWGAKLGKSLRSLRYWIQQGCDFDDPESVRQFVEIKTIKGRQNARGRATAGSKGVPRAGTLKVEPTTMSEPPAVSTETVELPGNGEKLLPVGRRGAAAALERLESQEEHAHRRLEVALANGNRFQIQDAQEFWLKCSETLRRLDLAVEVARRQEETQVPLKTAAAAVLATAEWMRIAFRTFFSSESQQMLGMKTVGELKAYAFERFRGILEMTIKAADKTNSPVPDWAKEQIKTGWNMPVD